MFPRALARVCRTVALVVAVVASSASLAAADEWLVYIGGGLESIEGGWSEQRGRVVFERVGGTLTSVPFEDVDLAASTFITWQLEGRRRVPPRASVEKPAPLPEDSAAPPCLGARLSGMLGPESFEIAIGAEREIVHVACLDAPESNQRLPALGWFGRAAASAIEIEVRPGAEVCLTEQTPPRRDGDGHRIVAMTLGDGRDYATMVIGAGFGVLRPTECRDGARYRAAEDVAIQKQRGLWGQSGTTPAFEAARLGAASVPPGSRGAVRGGCRMRR